MATWRVPSSTVATVADWIGTSAELAVTSDLFRRGATDFQGRAYVRWHAGVDDHVVQHGRLEAGERDHDAVGPGDERRHRENTPLSDVTVVNVSPVATFVTITSAPGTTTPSASTTTPEMEAVEEP